MIAGWFRLDNIVQCCWQPGTMLLQQHCCILFSTTSYNDLKIFCRVLITESVWVSESCILLTTALWRKTSKDMKANIGNRAKHRRTGHEILGGGQTLVCPTRGLDECRSGSPGAFSPAKILKCRVSQMPFPAFWEWNYSFFNAFLPVRTNCFHMIRKIARLLGRNCPTN